MIMQNPPPPAAPPADDPPPDRRAGLIVQAQAGLDQVAWQIAGAIMQALATDQPEIAHGYARLLAVVLSHREAVANLAGTQLFADLLEALEESWFDRPDVGTEPAHFADPPAPRARIACALTVETAWTQMLAALESLVAA